jgi:hypothetical protein
MRPPSPSLQEIRDYVRYVCKPPAPPGESHLFAHLDRTGFFAGSSQIMEVACGPSPHVGWHLRPRVSQKEVYFVDWQRAALRVHKMVYQELSAAEPSRAEREYWRLGDAQSESHLLTDKAVIVHGALPRLRDAAGKNISPTTPERMRRTLAGLLDAHPERLAMYLSCSETRPDNIARVLPALDSLGVRYRCYDNVDSAHFMPQPGGYLVLITP